MFTLFSQESCWVHWICEVLRYLPGKLRIGFNVLKCWKRKTLFNCNLSYGILIECLLTLFQLGRDNFITATVYHMTQHSWNRVKSSEYWVIVLLRSCKRVFGGSKILLFAGGIWTCKGPITCAHGQIVSFCIFFSI